MGDVCPGVLPNSFGADALSNHFGLFTQFDVFFIAIHILYEPKDPVCIYFSKHKLGVVGKVDIALSDAIYWTGAALKNP